MIKILYWHRFGKQYKRLPKRLQELVEEKGELFRKDPFNPALRTHKLSGKLEGRWAFSVNYSLRVIFWFEDPQTALFYSIGNHDIYN